MLWNSRQRGRTVAWKYPNTVFRRGNTIVYRAINNKGNTPELPIGTCQGEMGEVLQGTEYKNQLNKHLL